MKDNFIGQTFPTPNGGVLTVVGVVGKSGSHKKYGLTCSICSEDKELFPELFESRKGSLVNGKVPCGCSKSPNWKPFQVEIIARRLCVDAGYEFLGFPEGYKNQRSKFEYNCPTHGKQKVSYNNFVNDGSRCPSCAVSGYDQSKPGYFYLFKYEKKDQDLIPVYKFGITNRLTKIRSNEHIAGIKGVKSKMIYEWYFDDGSIPKKMETYIKENYETGISNWLTSGNTETLSANDASFEVEAGNILMSQMM